MYKIEKGIPIVPQVNHRPKYPFDQMEIGDSFAFETGKEKTIAAAAGMFAKRNPGYKFSVRVIDNKVARCWRIRCLA